MTRRNDGVVMRRVKASSILTAYRAVWKQSKSQDRGEAEHNARKALEDDRDRFVRDLTKMESELSRANALSKPQRIPKNPEKVSNDSNIPNNQGTGNASSDKPAITNDPDPGYDRLMEILDIAIQEARNAGKDAGG